MLSVELFITQSDQLFDGIFIRHFIAWQAMKPSAVVQKMRQMPVLGYLCAFLGTTVGTVLLSPVRADFDLSNTALLYVLAVLVVAVSFGRGPAVATALYSALCYAYVFVPPHFSLAITELQYLLSAVIMLIVALIVGHLTSRLKHHADELQRKSASSRGLYMLARELAGAQTPEEIQQVTSGYLEAALGARNVSLLRPEAFAGLEFPLSPALAQQCLERQQFLSRPTQEGYFVALLPLCAANGVLGIMNFEVSAAALGTQEAVEYVETVASVVAVALERSRFVEIARETEIKHSAEALRSSILSALSHDLRTPLTALVGMVDTVALGKLPAEKQRPMLESIRNQTLSISHQMTNLLEMARLSEGKFSLNTAWQPIEEVLGATLHQAKLQWKEREFDLDLASGLPPIRIDAVLMERVFWNLIENAVKYSPEGEPIGISVVQTGEAMEISVCDRGPGISVGMVACIFETFQRGRVESDIPGVGLGLSIARTIVAAHGGELVYQAHPGGGSCFTVRLPLEQVPAYETMGEMP